MGGLMWNVVGPMAIRQAVEVEHRLDNLELFRTVAHHLTEPRLQWTRTLARRRVVSFRMTLPAKRSRTSLMPPKWREVWRFSPYFANDKRPSRMLSSRPCHRNEKALASGHPGLVPIAAVTNSGIMDRVSNRRQALRRLICFAQGFFANVAGMLPPLMML